MVKSDLDLIIQLKKPTSRELKILPVWDNFIDSVIIHKSDMPNVLVTYLYNDIKNHVDSKGLPQKFSGKLKGEIESIISKCIEKLYLNSGIITKTPIVLRKLNSLLVFLSDVPHVNK